MKNYIFLSFFFFSVSLFGQEPSNGTIEKFVLNSKALVNSGGENPNRNVSVYLPPGYGQTNQDYPVIYYLHGYMGKDSIYPRMKNILDQAIQMKKIRPFILVQADHYTLFEGSFYSNSSLIGNWEDFQVYELVEYIDDHYRTIKNKNSRGIGGHSMGGYGAIKLGMLHPEIFSSVYGLSPGLMAFVKEFGPNSYSFRAMEQIKTVEELKKSYYPRVLVAVGRAWSPNPEKPPFFCDMPFTYEGDTLNVNQDVLEKWHKNMPFEMANAYSNNLKQLKALKLDWGRNDASRFPTQNMLFSQKIENLGIKHFAEEYIGTHGNKIWTDDGRVLNSMLPFFNDFLEF